MPREGRAGALTAQRVTSPWLQTGRAQLPRPLQQRHADLAGERMQRDTADAVIASETPRPFDDRCQLGIASLCRLTYHR